MAAALQRISGREPVFQTETRFPSDGPVYSVVARIIWDCPREKLEEAARIVDWSFRSAPGNAIAGALYKLRILTIGRDARSSDDQEAEAIIWGEQLACWPGDIALEVLADWPKRKDGKFWPTWADVLEELRRRMDRRMALANHIKRLLAKPSDAAQLAPPKPLTDEERAEIVERVWERGVRDGLVQRPAKPKETPQQALDRLAKEPLKVSIGPSLGAVLDTMSAQRKAAE